MMYQEIYDKIQGLKQLDLLFIPDNLDVIEDDYMAEFLYMRNITPELFIKLDEDVQRTMIALLSFYSIELYKLIDDNLLNELNDLVFPSDDEAFNSDLLGWEKSTLLAKPVFNELTTLNDIKLWHYNNTQPKFIYERMMGVPIEVIYKRGRYEKATVGGYDITKNAVYFNGMVKELDDPMDCVVSGVTTIMKDDINTVKSIIQLEAINVKPTAEAIASQLKGRNEELFEHMTFIAENIQITNIHHTGENVI